MHLCQPPDRHLSVKHCALCHCAQQCQSSSRLQLQAVAAEQAPAGTSTSTSKQSPPLPVPEPAPGESPEHEAKRKFPHSTTNRNASSTDLLMILSSRYCNSLFESVKFKFKIGSIAGHISPHLVSYSGRYAPCPHHPQHQPPPLPPTTSCKPLKPFRLQVVFVRLRATNSSLRKNPPSLLSPTAPHHHGRAERSRTCAPRRSRSSLAPRPAFLLELALHLVASRRVVARFSARPPLLSAEATFRCS